MNLDYGKEYEDFKKEVESFCREYSGVIITNKKGGALTALNAVGELDNACLLYTSPSPRDPHLSRMPSSA